VTFLGGVSPRMLVVDEVHHLLGGTYREQRASLNLLKFLANDLQISMVQVGTRDASAGASDRFPDDEPLYAVRAPALALERRSATTSRRI
jgi:Bacterial TniB protein